MKIKQLLPVIVCLSVIASCNKKENKNDPVIENTIMAEVPSASDKDEGLQQLSVKSEQKKEGQKIPVSDNQVVADTIVASPSGKNISNHDWDNKIIKTATVRLEVKDFKGYSDKVHQTVKQFGGYIAQEEQNLRDDKSETSISIKVPVAQFEGLMNQLSAGDVTIAERKITTEDVTGEYVDTRSRLEAKKQMRLKYLEFLKQSKNMAEVLQVQSEVNSIQEEIESASGRVQFLSHQSAYSTINLTFFQPLAGYTPSEDNPSFFKRVTGAFSTGANWIAELFVGLISIWPLLLIIFGIYFGWKKMFASKKLPANP